MTPGQTIWRVTDVRVEGIIYLCHDNEKQLRIVGMLGRQTCRLGKNEDRGEEGTQTEADDRTYIDTNKPTGGLKRSSVN